MQLKDDRSLETQGGRSEQSSRGWAYKDRERERKRDGEARAKEVPSDVELRSSRATRLGTWACRRACYAIDYAL